MKKIVYLIGTGATKAEMQLQGSESDLSMVGIANSIRKMSAAINGEFYQLLQTRTIAAETDIELLISLLEGCGYSESKSLEAICIELRSLFRKYLLEEIVEHAIKPMLVRDLIMLHKKHTAEMGDTGELLTGIFTINFDSLIDDSFHSLYGGINYGCGFQSDTYKEDRSIPPLLKLHGSFNWKINDNKLIVSKQFEQLDYTDDFSGWIPPSVYKKPENIVFQSIWKKALELLVDCDVLRIIGSSLRNEDFALISLLFNSQIISKKPFTTEMIIPDKDTTGINGIYKRLPFLLGTIINLDALPIFAGYPFSGDNVFLSWLNRKISEVEQKTTVTNLLTIDETAKDVRR